MQSAHSHTLEDESSATPGGSGVHAPDICRFKSLYSGVSAAARAFATPKGLRFRCAPTGSGAGLGTGVEAVRRKSGRRGRRRMRDGISVVVVVVEFAGVKRSGGGRVRCGLDRRERGFVGAV